MNYTYLANTSAGPNSPPSGPVIVMTSNPASKKTHNIVANPNVSLLVHDWVSHRPLNRRMSQGSLEEGNGGAAPAEHTPSPLAALLLNLNTAAVSSISATINGTAQLLAQGSPEETYYRQQHLANNTFDADPVGPQETRIHQQIANASNAGASTARGSAQDGSDRFVAGEEVRVIVVKVRDVRISDWKGQVRDWVLEEPTPAPVINGVLNH